MYLRMFHTARRVWQNFSKRIIGLFRFILDYKIVMFSILYIMFNSLSIFLLRNIDVGTTIGWGLFSFFIFIFLFFLIWYVKLKWKFSKDREVANSSGERSFKICVLFFFGFCIFVSAYLRNSSIITNEKRIFGNVQSFTESSTKLRVYMVDEVEEKHVRQQVTARLLGDINFNGEILGKNESLILLRLPNFYKFQIGQVCEVEGLLSEPKNFEDFNYKKFLANKKIFFLMDNPKIFCQKISDARGGNFLKNILVDLKTKLIENIDSVLNEPQSSLLAGILFGQRRLFSKSFEEATRVSGVSHIVAASGYNVTILSIAINKLFFFLPKRFKLIVSLIVIWMFAILSGFSASIVRACMMGSVSIIALLFGRSNSVHLALPFVSFLFVLFTPFAVSDVSFLLSISAVLGLVYILPILTMIKEKITRKHKFLDDFVLPTLSCTLSTLPLSIFTFKTFSIWSVPVNTLVLPVVESTMFFGLLALLFQYIFPPFSYIFFSVVNVQLKYFEFIVNFVQKLNFGQVSLSEPFSQALSLIVLLFLLLLIIFFYPIKNEKYNYYLKNS